MSCIKIMASVAIVSLLSTSAHAQVKTVNELPITYTDAGVIKAQHIKPGDVSPEEYQRLINEADKIRAFRNNSGSYTSDSSATTSYTSVASPSAGIVVDSEAPVAEFAESYKTFTDENGYEIQLFEGPASDFVEPTTTYASTTTYQPTQISVPVTQLHTVVKDDTIYRLAKSYGVSQQDIRTANGLSNDNIRLGQTLSIPQTTTTMSTESFHAAPATTFASSPETRTESEPFVYGSTTQAATSSNLSQVFEAQSAPKEHWVLPGDNLYRIGLSVCASPDAVAALNGISVSSALQPAQVLKLPANNCSGR